MKFSPHIEDVPSPPISEVKRLLPASDSGRDRPLVDMCQAVPDYPPAPELTAYLKTIVARDDVARYTPDEGLQETRESLSRWYQRRYGAAPTADQICLTIGASQAFWLAIMVLCRAGDEVLLPAPAYFDHIMALQALGVKRRWLPYREAEGGGPEPDLLAAMIGPRTRAILLVTPSNPTGEAVPPDVLQRCFEVARAHDIALLLDETYNAFLPPGERPHDLFGRSDWERHFIHLASFGKTFALTGFRAGALVAGREVLGQALKVQDTMAVCQPAVTQHALRHGCDHLDAWVSRNAVMMQERHGLFRDLMTRAETPFTLLASGGFFAWVKHPWPRLSSREAVIRLLRDCHLAALPGAAFGPDLEPYLRLAFGNLPVSAIPAAVARLSVTT